METIPRWKGDPVIVLAEFPFPQSRTDATCAPQARTTVGVATATLNVTLMVVVHVPPLVITPWLT
jgi:hypothetical protein